MKVDLPTRSAPMTAILISGKGSASWKLSQLCASTGGAIAGTYPVLVERLKMSDRTDYASDLVFILRLPSNGFLRRNCRPILL